MLILLKKAKRRIGRAFRIFLFRLDTGFFLLTDKNKKDIMPTEVRETKERELKITPKPGLEREHGQVKDI